MHEDLERLDRVDRLDREMADRKRKLEALEQALKKAGAAVTAAEEEVGRRAAALTENRDAQRIVQRKLSDYRNNRSSAVRLLETGQGDPEAAERQVQRCDALIDESETELLELLEAQDEREAAKEASDQALRQSQSHQQVLADSAPTERAGLEQERASMATERASHYEALPRDIVSRYDHWQARQKWAVARVVDGTCDACQMDVAAQHLADLKRGLIAPCHRCRRWLIPPRL